MIWGRGDGWRMQKGKKTTQITPARKEKSKLKLFGEKAMAILL